MFAVLITVAAGLAILLGSIHRAGATNPMANPWPFGLIEIPMGGYVPNLLNSANSNVDVWIAPFDCYVRKVVKTYRGGTAHLDTVLLTTIDSVLPGPAVKTVVASVDETADVLGVSQTLHADIIDYLIVTGNGLILKGDAQGANESGQLNIRVYVEPANMPVATGG